MLVHEEVASLAKQVQRNSGVIEEAKFVPCGECIGRVDEESAQQTGRGPVEERVAEDVEGGHGRGGEAVQEGSLQLTLEEMRNEHVVNGLLDERDGCLVGILVEEGIDLGKVRATVVEQGVEDEGAEVLDEEDGAPRHLGT